MKGKKEVTIYDIARELNVSPSTVSRALKDHSSIGKETKNAVKKLALKRGYRPNSIAASLRSNKTNTIGIITTWINRPFNSSLISGVEEYANSSGYNVIISQSYDTYNNEVANAQALYASRVSGLIISLAMETKKFDHIMPFIKKGIPVVFVDRVAEDLNTDTVVVNNFSAAFNATQHLIEQGCKRIAHFGGAQLRNVYRDRQNGYIAALRHHGLPVDERLIVNANTLSFEEGIKCMDYLLKLDQIPDGLFTSNDTSAVSAIQFMKKKGIRVPEDIAVIGFNDDPIALIIDPPLSTVKHPAVEMGKIAARQILNQKDHKEIVKSENIVLKTDLIIRESSLRKS